MKTIGLIGGMSWESSVTYYRLINEGIKERLGGFHSARCVLYSVDFAPIEQTQAENRWEDGGAMLAEAALALEKAGADFFLIATNTMHKVAHQVQAAMSIPLLHIAEVAAARLVRDGRKTVALLGTRYTMEQDFYKEKLHKAGLGVLVPEEQGRADINRIIFEELCLGVVSEKSKQVLLGEVENLARAGADCVLLGCTEIGLLLAQQDTALPLYDTTVLHAEAAVEEALL